MPEAIHSRRWSRVAGNLLISSQHFVMSNTRMCSGTDLRKEGEGQLYSWIRVPRGFISRVAEVRVVTSASDGVAVAAKLSLPARIGPDSALDAAARTEAAVLMMTPGPPVWTAMSVCSQSISLVVPCVQNGLVDDRRVAGSAVLFTNWSEV